MDALISVSCLLPAGAEEDLAAVLDRCSTRGAWLQPAAGDRVRAVVFLAPSSGDRPDAVERGLRGIGATDVSRSVVAEQDWLAPYRLTAKPFAVGEAWWVEPRLDGSGVVPTGRIALRIEPSTAFGSGSHESTRLVLMALEGTRVRGTDVLDIGCGSGILALAAESLGARRVVAVDIDPVAVFTARRAARRQCWPARPALVVGGCVALGGTVFDIVLCNMVTGLLVPQLPEIRRLLAPGGRAVLAGLLRSELEDVRGAVALQGLRVTGESILGEWASVEAVGE